MPDLRVSRALLMKNIAPTKFKLAAVIVRRQQTLPPVSTRLPIFRLYPLPQMPAETLLACAQLRAIPMPLPLPASI